MGKIFDNNLDIKKTAYMNWLMDSHDNANNLYVIGNGYSEAALILIDSILFNNCDKKADRIIFPLLYNINQSIELLLKATIWVLERKESDKPTTYNEHDINALYCQMIAKIKRKEQSTKGLIRHFDALTNYIDELYQKIGEKGEKPHIDFARYPTDINSKSYYYVETYNNEMVDIENLKKNYLEIIESLNSIYLMYKEEPENNTKEQ